MSKTIMKIQELMLQDHCFTISVQIQCKYNVFVRSPKVNIVFHDGEQTRNLPMRIETTHLSESKEEIIIIAKYTYRLNCIFIPYNPLKEISCTIDLAYGNEYEAGLAFTLDNEIEIDHCDYNIVVNEEQNKILFKPVLEASIETTDNSFFQQTKYVLKVILKRLYMCFSIFVAIMLLPYFVLDSIATKLRLSPSVKGNTNKGLKWFLVHIRCRFSAFIKYNVSITKFKGRYLNYTYQRAQKKKVVPNRVTFLSSRRDDMTGNLAFVYDELKDRADLDIQVLLDSSSFKDMSLRNIRHLSYLCATSKVILIDDFFPTLNRYQLKSDTKLIQLWHACGAFKTFGFTRLGKKGGPTQRSLNHRNYDYAIVSSQTIAKYYAQGFGISEHKVVATGVPRTDIFFDAQYKEKIEKEFYTQYPKLKDKKILLFAPTFRGNGKESAFYPDSCFDPVRIYEEIKGEYAILIKHHPFVKKEFTIDEKYKDYIVDMSMHSEINDLLFVTDLVVTDYSSLIFEASLLNIPMLFYAYDLNRYIATRDFYYDYETFVPGKIVQNESNLIKAIVKQDFEQEKISSFRKRFFDHDDGKSTKRVVELVEHILKGE